MKITNLHARARAAIRRPLPRLLLVLAAALPATAWSGPSGQAMAFTCAGCHGTDGSSVGPSMPAIAGMDPEVFVDAMKAYRDDERNPSIMNRIAKAYSDEQFEAMGWFFASKRLHVYPQPFDPALAERGALLHDDYCEKCHENGGRPGDAGTLAGQWMPYLQFTMEDFLDGKRKWPRKMRRKVDAAMREAGDAAIPALLNYYASYASNNLGSPVTESSAGRSGDGAGDNLADSSIGDADDKADATSGSQPAPAEQEQPHD